MTGPKRTAEASGFDEHNTDDRKAADEVSTSPQIVRRLRYTKPCRPSDDGETDPTQKHQFDVFKALVRHRNLFFEFAHRLQPKQLMDLYALDKEFHYRFNQYYNSIIHDYVKYHAPEAGYIFGWSLYPELCIPDPMERPMDGRPHLPRDVPSLKWVNMVMERDAIVKEILTCMALEGHRVPKETMKAVMKCWMTMGMNEQAKRKRLIRSRDIWTDADILLFQLFLVKLDMLFGHPIQGGRGRLSRLLLTQKSLVTLRDILTGRLTMDYDLLGTMVIRTHHPSELNLDDHDWMDNEVENNVDEWEWGMMTRERWSDRGGPMESVVDMVIHEGIRRGLHVQQYYLDFVLYGYVNMDTGENLPLPRKWRRDKEVVVPEQGWPRTTERNELVASLDAAFGVSH